MSSPGKSALYSPQCLVHKGELGRWREEVGEWKHCLSSCFLMIRKLWGKERDGNSSCSTIGKASLIIQAKQSIFGDKDRFVTFRIVAFYLQELWQSSFIHAIQVLTEEQEDTLFLWHFQLSWPWMDWEVSISLWHIPIPLELTHPPFGFLFFLSASKIPSLPIDI